MNRGEAFIHISLPPPQHTTSNSALALASVFAQAAALRNEGHKIRVIHVLR